MISFFYKAWAVNQQNLSFEKGDKNDHIKQYLYSLIGHNYETIKRFSSLTSDAKLYYSGHLINNSKGKEKLTAILSSYFQIPVNIKEYIEEWVDIDSSEFFSLGSSEANGCLGESIILGCKVWSCSGKFRIVLGPMPIDKYFRLLPGTLGFRQLLEWVKTCSPFELDWDIQFILKADAVLLSRKKYLLGYSSWLLAKEPNNDAGDLIINFS